MPNETQDKINAFQVMHEKTERNGCDTPAVYKDGAIIRCFNCDTTWTLH